MFVCKSLSFRMFFHLAPVGEHVIQLHVGRYHFGPRVRVSPLATLHSNLCYAYSSRHSSVNLCLSYLDMTWKSWGVCVCVCLRTFACSGAASHTLWLVAGLPGTFADERGLSPEWAEAEVEFDPRASDWLVDEGFWSGEDQGDNPNKEAKVDLSLLSLRSK